MQTTTLEITEIPIETFKALGELAQQNGKSPTDFVREMIEQEVLEQPARRKLSDRDRDLFLAMLDADGEPNDALRNAFETHQQLNGVPAKAKAPLDKRVPCEPMTDRTREFNWIEEHKHEYAGQWVVLDGDRLIAASPIRAEISVAVKAAGAKVPLIHRIPSPDDLPYIGI